MHHNVDFGVGSSTTDVPCHNLNFVHNTCRVQLHARLSVSLSVGHYGSRLPDLPEEPHWNQIQKIYKSDSLAEELIATQQGLMRLGRKHISLFRLSRNTKKTVNDLLLGNVISQHISYLNTLYVA